MAGNPASLGPLTEAQLIQIFTAVSTAKTADSARDWQNLGMAVTGAVTGGGADSGPTSLKAMDAELRNNWQGHGADAFTNKMNQIGAWGTEFAALLGGGPMAVSGILNTVAEAQRSAFNNFHSTKQAWDDFTQSAAKYFNSLVSGGDPTGGPGSTGPTGGGSSSAVRTSYAVSPAAGNVSTGTATWQVSYSKNGYLATAAGTSDMDAVASAGVIIPGYSNFKITQILQGPAPYDGAQPHGAAAGVSGTVSFQQIDQANQDQFMSDLRSYLDQLGQTYAAAAASFPAKKAPLSTRVNDGTGGAGPQYGGANGATTPLNNPALTGNQGANVPLTSASGGTAANNPLTSANGANGALSQSGATPTSLASAPTATGLNSGLNSGLSSGLSSGVPTGTAGLGTTPITGGAGSLPGLGNTGAGLPMVMPPVAGGVLPASEFGGGKLPAEFGGGGLGAEFGGGGLGAEGGLTGGEFGAIGELNPGGAGALGEGALAAEGATAAELAAGARGGAPMMPFLPMSPMMGGSEGAERRRTAWLDEEDDIWAAGADPAPAVIGGEP